VDLLLAIMQRPLWLSILLLVIVPSLIAAGGPWVVRRFFPVEAIAANNEVAGFKFATIGVVYAVLLGLAVISVWERFSEADSAATEEAAALASIERLADGLAPADGVQLRNALTRYANAVIDDEWPAMARSGGRGETTHTALQDLYRVVLGLGAPDQRSAVLLGAIVTQLDIVTDSRRERLDAAEGILPGVIWLVLFVGAVVVLGFTFFFGLDSVAVQMLMTGMLALLIFLALFVALAIDHPFAGATGVQPDAMQRVLRDFAAP
jgi:hypothetical protein